MVEPDPLVAERTRMLFPARIGPVLLAAALILLISAVGLFGLALLSAVPANAQQPTQQPLSGSQSDRAMSAAVTNSGFLPTVNGYSFSNYLNSRYKLTPAWMVFLFGRRVCVSGSGSSCKLTPPARAWMRQENRQLSGGFCTGFSVSSSLFFSDYLSPRDFGGTTTASLKKTPNVQSLIATEWTIFDLAFGRREIVVGRPALLLKKLVASFKAHKQAYTLVFYKRNWTGGHAVTPFAVERKGGKKYDLLLYDNNDPLKTRVMHFNGNKWSYDARVSPDEPSDFYTGNAKTGTLMLLPTAAARKIQPCPFCRAKKRGKRASSVRSSGAAVDFSGSPPNSPASILPNALGSTLPVNQQYNEVSLLGNPIDLPQFSVRSTAGQLDGVINGELSHKIPGSRVDVEVRSSFDAFEPADPSFDLPVKTQFSATIDGSTLKRFETQGVDLIGPGYDLTVSNLRLGPGSKDILSFAHNGQDLTLHTPANQTQSPVLSVGEQGSSADNNVTVKLPPLLGGSTVEIALNANAGTVTLKTKGTKQPSGRGRFSFNDLRETATGSRTFRESVSLLGGETVILRYRLPESSPLSLHVIQSELVRHD